MISKNSRNVAGPHYASTVWRQEENMHSKVESNVQVALCQNMLYFGNEFVCTFFKASTIQIMD